MKLSPWLLIAALSVSAASVASCTGPKMPAASEDSATEPGPQTAIAPRAEPSAGPSPEPNPEPDANPSPDLNPEPSIFRLSPETPSTTQWEPAPDESTPVAPSTPEPTTAFVEPAPQKQSDSPATDVAKPSAASPNAVSAPTDDRALLTDTAVIPGERVGPITRGTSRERLADLFGEDRLSDQPVDIGEGFTEPGTVVDLGPEQSFTIVWQDGSRSQPAVVRDFGPAWQTPEGLGVGTSFEELKTVLGAFQLYGFAWDYEGSLVFEDSQLDAYQGQLTLRVTPDPAAIATHKNAYQALVGDVLFSSNDPNLEPLDISVYEMIVYLNGG
ncbi:MAG: hypothetical protein AAGF01_24485 [Cyanobacteria bacterium P01_G01_bin.38]